MSPHVHGTAVAIDGRAVLLTGRSGSGKSDLALRLIDRGAALVGDDSVAIDNDLNVLARGDGKIEIYGLGIFELPYVASAPLRLLVELGEDCERMPASWPLAELCGHSLPKLRLDAFAASAPLKIEYAIKSLIDDGPLPVRFPVTEP